MLVAALQTQLKDTDQYTQFEPCDTGFAGVNHALCNAPVLALPDFNMRSEIITVHVAWARVQCCYKMG